MSRPTLSGAPRAEGDMNDPDAVRRAFRLVKGARAAVAEQRQRIVALQAVGSSTNEAVVALGCLEASLSALEYGLDLTQQARPPV